MRLRFKKIKRWQKNKIGAESNLVHSRDLNLEIEQRNPDIVCSLISHLEHIHMTQANHAHWSRRLANIEESVYEQVTEIL